MKRWVNIVAVAVGQFLSFPLPVVLGFEAGSSWGWLFVLAWLAGTSSLYTRHAHPVRMSVLVVGSLLVTLAASVPYLGLWWVAPAAVYHWARYGSRRVRWAALVACAVGSLVGGWAFLRLFDAYNWSAGELAAMFAVAVFICLAITVIAWFFGDTRRLRENRQRALIERNRQLEHEREQERAMAALDERARIAREMHDIVAHSLSVIIAQADGARYAAGARAASSPTGGGEGESAQEPVELTALGTISEAARSSLAQMRSLLGVLRTDEGSSFQPLPALHNVPQLVEAVQAMGIPVQLSLVSGVEDRLPRGADLTVYRIVQETLTNVTRHCPGTPLVTVAITAGAKSLDIEVTNLPQTQASEPLPGARRGLLGMRERVDMYGGSLHYGRLADGSFRVFAQIPWAE